jgi:hypothetical protein
MLGKEAGDIVPRRDVLGIALEGVGHQRFGSGPQDARKLDHIMDEKSCSTLGGADTDKGSPDVETFGIDLGVAVRLRY